MRARTALAVVAAVLLGSSLSGLPAAAQQASQQAGRSDASALLSVADADPLELARIVQRIGDAAVLRLLAAGRPVAARLAAARAAPWLRAPERALGPLARLLVGRDPVLVEAAARAVLRVVERLDAGALSRREVGPAELAPARTALLQAAARPALREDLRLLLQQAAALLEGMGVPGPPAGPQS